jgi:SAM-dependent methyltransferase
MDYKEYVNLTKNRTPSKLLLEALNFVNGKNALDLGSGGLKDTKYLLSKGYDVVAVDKEPLLVELPYSNSFKFVLCKFQDYNFSPEQFDLVNAQFSLPFMAEQNFNKVWKNLLRSLKSNAIFTGQFFGKEDDWNKLVDRKDMTFHSLSEVKNLLKELEVLKLEEIKKQGTLADGTTKYWHYFDVIARKY